MSLGRAWRRSRRLVPANGDLRDLVAIISHRRRRRIQLLPWSFDPAGQTPSGLWLRLDDHDVIVYPANNPTPRQIAVVCHELAHMLLGHDADQEQPDDAKITLAQLVAPDLTPSAAIRLLGRHGGYADAREVEAETLGTRLTIALRAAQMQPADRITQRLR